MIRFFIMQKLYIIIQLFETEILKSYILSSYFKFLKSSYMIRINKSNNLKWSITVEKS